MLHSGSVQPFNGAPDDPLTRDSGRDSIRSNLSEPLMTPSLSALSDEVRVHLGNERRHFGLA